MGVEGFGAVLIGLLMHITVAALIGIAFNISGILLEKHLEIVTVPKGKF